ncbi:MAG: hypothetical protein ACOYXT_02060 [Bacteroidota bacterium]
MKKIIYALFGLTGLQIMLVRCHTETSGLMASYIKNPTPYNISLKYYRGGQLAQRDTLNFVAGETKNVFNSIPMDGSPTYADAVQLFYDSLLITFDNKQATHYGWSKAGKNPDAISFDHPRNIFNKNNWTIKIFRNTSKHFDGEAIYIFTEDDYVNAKSR